MKFQSLNEAIQSVTNPQPKVSSSLVEEQRYIEEYIELLEFALESIAEEMECSVEDLLEDVQTPARAAQSTRMINKAWLHANTSESNKEENKRNRKYHKIFNKREMESKSKKTYGMGGKIVKKATMKEDTETPLRNAENNKAIKNLKGAARKSLDNWAIHRQSPHDRNHTSRGYKLQDKFVAVQKKLEDRTALQQKEQKSKTRYGVGGKRRKTK
jgi:hypothetical protein